MVLRTVCVCIVYIYKEGTRCVFCECLEWSLKTTTQNLKLLNYCSEIQLDGCMTVQRVTKLKQLNKNRRMSYCLCSSPADWCSDPVNQSRDSSTRTVFKGFAQIQEHQNERQISATSVVARVLARYARVFQTSLILRVSVSQQVLDRTARKTKNIQRETVTQTETPRWLERTEERRSTGSSRQCCGNKRNLEKEWAPYRVPVRSGKNAKLTLSQRKENLREKNLSWYINSCAKYGNAQECSGNAGSIRSCHKKTKKNQISVSLFFLPIFNQSYFRVEQDHWRRKKIIRGIKIHYIHNSVNTGSVVKTCSAWFVYDSRLEFRSGWRPCLQRRGEGGVLLRVTALVQFHFPLDLFRCVLIVVLLVSRHGL